MKTPSWPHLSHVLKTRRNLQAAIICLESRDDRPVINPRDQADYKRILEFRAYCRKESRKLLESLGLNIKTAEVMIKKLREEESELWKALRPDLETN